MQLRSFALTGALVAALALPASAAAATPPTIAVPDATSLAQSWPVFNWTPGPAGEYLTYLSMSTDPTVDEDGSIGYANGGNMIVEGSPAKDSRPLYAGTYYFNASWRTADGQPYERGVTPVQQFTIPQFQRALSGKFTQYGNITAFSVNGTYRTNVKISRVTCRIYSGRTLISSQKRAYTYNSQTAANRYYCSNLRVPERLDGKRLRLNVHIHSGAKQNAINRYFRAI